ncbi:MAG: hypothetical protein IKL10_06535 [Clostridia bacterium]|nr:hypothetical protein [Clostridia bacterium]
MIKQIKFSPKPGLIGSFMSVLLIVSFFLPRIWQNDSTVESLNTVLIVIILCLAVHLVRITSSLFFEHVWNNIGYTVLWLLPVLNLIVTACQFVWENLAFMQSPLFISFLVLFSLPSFCCYYFTVIILFCKRNTALIISTVLLDIIGFIYCFIRLADRVFLPAAVNMGHETASIIELMASLSPWFSLIIYILSFINFIICAKLFNSVLTASE